MLVGQHMHALHVCTLLPHIPTLKISTPQRIATHSLLPKRGGKVSLIQSELSMALAETWVLKLSAMTRKTRATSAAEGLQ